MRILLCSWYNIAKNAATLLPLAKRTWTWLTSSCRCCSWVLEAIAPCRDLTPLMSLLTTLPHKQVLERIYP